MLTAPRRPTLWISAPVPGPTRRPVSGALSSRDVLGVVAALAFSLMCFRYGGLYGLVTNIAGVAVIWGAGRRLADLGRRWRKARISLTAWVFASGSRHRHGRLSPTRERESRRAGTSHLALATEVRFAELARMSREPHERERFRRGHLLLVRR